MDAKLTLKVDIPNDFFDLDGYEHASEVAMHQIAWAAKDFWVTAAGQRLKTSRQQYIDGIKEEGTATAKSLTLILDGGWLPYAVEMGTPGYSMNVPRGAIVPLNVNRQIIFTSPKVWATGTGEPWKHPGFPGFNISDDVIDEIAEVLAPKYLAEALDSL